jgi:GrpB-like predicted nucleotidyltransferase (UPF0157 family)
LIRAEQQAWLDHLSDHDQVLVKPYDENAPRIFEVVRTKILAVLGPQTRVEHRGATNLGISGQDEIDVYIPVSAGDFESRIAPLTAAFGSPRSHYPGERARFVLIEGGKHVDIFLIDAAGRGWLDGVRFEAFLKTHPGALEDYRQMKEDGHGLSTREYYRRKIEFINDILRQADMEDAQRKQENGAC